MSMKQVWLKYKLFVFDLDDTLYEESKYLFLAYHQIATKASMGDKQKEVEYTAFLCNTFEQEGSTNLFQKFKEQYGIAMDVEEMVECLHHTPGVLHLLEHMQQLIADLLACGKNVAVLTNGNVEQQRQKVRNLRLATLFPELKICYAAQVAPKPSPKALFELMHDFNVDASETLMIGDSDVDEQTAENAGVVFLQINQNDIC